MRPERLADRSRVEHVAGGLEPAAEERVRGAAEPDAARSGGIDHRLRVRERRGQRLLGVHVLAGLDRGEADLRVADRGREVDDDVDRRVREQVVQRQRAEARGGGERGGAGRVGVGAGDELDRGERRAPGDVVLRDVAAADEADAGGTDGHRAAQARDERARPRPTRYSMDPVTASITGPAAWSSSTISHSAFGASASAAMAGAGSTTPLPTAPLTNGWPPLALGGSAGPSLRWSEQTRGPRSRMTVAGDGAADHDPEDVDLEVDRRIGRVAQERVARTGALDVLHLPVVVVDPDAEPVPGRDRGARVERVREAADVVVRVEPVPRDDDPGRPDRRRVRADPVERVGVVDRCPGVGARHGESRVRERRPRRGDVAARDADRLHAAVPEARELVEQPAIERERRRPATRVVAERVQLDGKGQRRGHGRESPGRRGQRPGASFRSGAVDSSSTMAALAAVTWSASSAVPRSSRQ